MENLNKKDTNPEIKPKIKKPKAKTWIKKEKITEKDHIDTVKQPIDIETNTGILWMKNVKELFLMVFVLVSLLWNLFLITHINNQNEKMDWLVSAWKTCTVKYDNMKTEYESFINKKEINDTFIKGKINSIKSELDTIIPDETK